MIHFDKKLLQSLDFKAPWLWIATWFGCGFMRPAPGTWGTLGGLPFALIFLGTGGWPLLLLAALLVTWAGYRAAARFENATKTHDNSSIVVDEVAGLWIALLPAGLSPLLIAAGFFLFRFFDILKPWPVGWADKKVRGAAGVMLDDLLAGGYAALIIGILRYAGLG